MTKTYQVKLKEDTGLKRENNYLQFGMPLPAGEFFNHRELQLNAEDGSILPSAFSVTALWPDNSIKWCLLETLVSMEVHQELALSISSKNQSNDHQTDTEDFISETDTEILIHTRSCQFKLSKQRFNFLDKVAKGNDTLIERGEFIFSSSNDERLDAKVNSFQYRSISCNTSPIPAQLEINGTIYTENQELIANFQAIFRFYIASDSVKISFTIHNPKPARHESGLWDLGDKNSLYFNNLSLGLKIEGNLTTQSKIEHDQPWSTLESSPFTIYQESSGGIHWNSPVHKNRFNLIPLTQNGYQCLSGSKVLLAGQRATPILKINNGKGNISVYVEKFWQNFPKAMAVSDNEIQIGLFPQQFKDGFELQPGEKKTHHLYLSFSDDEIQMDTLISPLQINLNPAWIEHCKVFPHFQCRQGEDAILDLIGKGLSDENNFYNKREAIDEYGWRNFGELYADHETDGYTGKELFISHYNNQYDPVYGFLRQFALTGDQRWFDLADDLARHVVDIDIYHTDYDKDEYNHGLFWHTDHYLDAETSSHRSYSKYQKSNAYADHAGGGGPGGQHCYTSGLLYHYLLTGNQSSRAALFHLTDWITKVYDGTGSVLDVFLAIKNRGRIDLKSITTGKYPLDRGTGNYMNALLDTFTLTQNLSTLKQVENIIQNTVHPLDDMSGRNLDKVETTWFYTVFLQSLCRYLAIKEERSELDDSFYYARDSLLHYADWMAIHEYPYLEKPQILEFPNHTWTAQDLRKVNILRLAAHYSAQEAPHFLDKAAEIYNYIVETLSNEKTTTYTRILALLMQNHGSIIDHKNDSPRLNYENIRNYQPLKPATSMSALMNISASLFQALRHFSLNREIIWLSRRSEKLAQFFGYRP